MILSILNGLFLNVRYLQKALYRLITVLVLSLLFCVTASAEHILRFGTGGTTGTYFPVGTLVAKVINERASASGKDDPLVVIAQRSNGSVANINDLSENLLELGLAQADIVSLAYQEEGQFENKNLKNTLRAVGTLYQESLHLVVSTESEIRSLGDLVGKRVSVDELGSGTQLDTEIVLAASGMPLEEIKLVYLKSNDSIERMRRGLLDAMFVVAGYPVDGLRQLVEDGIGRIIGLSDELISAITSEHLFLSAHSIPAGTYLNNEEIETLSVAAQMIVRSDVSTDVVYEITETMWSESMLNTLSGGHPRGADIRSDSALQGISIPLHPGALLYYEKHGYDTQDVPQ